MSIAIMHLNANKTEDSLRDSYHDGLFRTDASAQFVLAPGEQISTVMHFPNGLKGSVVPKGGGGFGYPNDPAARHDWAVTFTDRRVLFWSAMSEGLFSGAKARAGQASGAYIEYRHIQTVFFQESKLPGLVIPFVAASFSDLIAAVQIETTVEQAKAFMLELTTQLKKRTATDEHLAAMAPAVASTIDMFVGAAVDKLPAIAAINLTFVGPIATVRDDDDHLIPSLTAMDAYSDAGVTFNT